MIRRGDVFMVDFPFTDVGQSKVRPALVRPVRQALVSPGSMPVWAVSKTSDRSMSPSRSTSFWATAFARVQSRWAGASASPKQRLDVTAVRASNDGVDSSATDVVRPFPVSLITFGEVPGRMSIETTAGPGTGASSKPMSTLAVPSPSPSIGRASPSMSSGGAPAAIGTPASMPAEPVARW